MTVPVFLLVVQMLAPLAVFGETAHARLTDSSLEHSLYFCDLDEDQFNTFSVAVLNDGDVPVETMVVWAADSDIGIVFRIESDVFTLFPGERKHITGNFDPPPAGKTCVFAVYSVFAQVFFRPIGALDFTAGDTDVLQFRAVPGVPIDIKPGSDPNSINVKSKGSIPVAILSVPGFDAPSQVAFGVLQPTFGRTGDENSLLFCAPRSPEDVNGDGLLDLVCHFDTQMAGFKAGDTVGILNAHLVDGTPTAGIDSIRAFFPGDVNGDLRVNIIDLALVGSSFSSVPGSANWNPYADFDENGVINVIDLATVGQYFGQQV